MTNLSRPKRLTQPALLGAGWVALFSGLFLPFATSIAAAVKYRQADCSTGGIFYDFAPLLAACEPVSPALIVLGWLLTTVTLLSLSTAMFATALVAARLKELTRGGQVSAVFLLIATASVSAATCAVLASDPHQSYGIGAWIALTSTAGLLIYGVLGALCLIVVFFMTLAKPRPPT